MQNINDSQDHEEIYNESQEFQEEMKTFLRELGCEYVEGGANSRFNIALPGQANQIDACGKFGKYLILVECKAAKRRFDKPTDLREKILKWFGKIQLAKEAYKQIREYAECEEVIPIFATKKYRLTYDNIQLLKNGKDGIRSYYVDEQFIDYYSDLIDKIGRYAA
ncbi:hypothetical protein, partial [Desulfurella sp.]|uniref:hypothetical protein n=1 Tax=Desulfurella sp. TaxID=1962857 RepID=UPI0025BAB6D7